MKEFNPQVGGFPFFPPTDLLALQVLFKGGVEDQLKDVGNCVLQGCQVSGTQASASIAAGLVYIGGRICVFDAVAGVNLTSPQYIVASGAVDTNRNYGVGGAAGSKKVYSEYKASLTTTDPGAATRIQVDWANGANKRLVRLVQDVASPLYVEAASTAEQVISAASNTFVDVTPLSLTLSPGMYLLTSSVVAALQDAVSGAGLVMYSKIRNVTDNVDVASSLAALAGCQANAFVEGAGTIQAGITIYKSTIFRVQVARVFTSTPQLSKINNVFSSSPVSKLAALRLA